MLEHIAFLIMIITGSGSGITQMSQHKMPSMEVCQQAVSNAQLQLNNGDENERAAVIYCGYGLANVRTYIYQVSGKNMLTDKEVEEIKKQLQ